MNGGKQEEHGLKSLHRLAGEAVTTELIEAAAQEVLVAWFARRNSSFEATVLYGHIFGGIAALPALAACRLGVEIHRLFMLYIPREELEKKRIRWSQVLRLRQEEEERFARALGLRAKGESKGGGS